MSQNLSIFPTVRPSIFANGRIWKANYIPTLQIDQLEEIKDIVEMKVAHRKNIKRRKDKFGYESNSLIGLDMGDPSVIAPGAEDEENPFDS